MDGVSLNLQYEFTPQLGDLTQDGIIDILDIVAMVNLVIEILGNGYVPTSLELELADIYQDGQINVVDIVGLVNIILDN